MSEPKSQTPTQGKKKKGKGKTVALHEFLADTKVGGNVVEPVKRTTSWADATEEIDPVDISLAWEEDQHREKRETFDYSKLPTAPRSVRQANVDLSRLPKHPPYTLFLGNLSYEVNEDILARFFEDRKVKVSNIRLPTDSGTDRLKGFGYAEFRDVESLLAALQLNAEMVSNRPIRIDLANASDGGDDDSRGYNRRFNHSDDTSDWRRPSDESRSWRGNSPRDNYERGPSPRRGYNDRGSDKGGRWQSSGRRQDYDSPPRGGRDRFDGRDHYDDRDRYESRDRDDNYGDRHGDRRGDDRWQHDRYDDYGGNRRGRGHSPRGGRRFDDRDRRRDFGRPSERDTYRREMDSDRDRPKERPKLQLQPRSKPVEPESELSPGSQASIFGGAKPVDTATKELMVEEKLRRKEEEEKILAEEKKLKEKEEREREQEALRREKEKEKERSGIEDDWRKSRDKAHVKRGGESSRGSRGDRGSYGDRGERGDRGSYGDRGDRGDRGNYGDRGDRGSYGDRGDRGSHGNRGERGDRGSYGDRGERGDRGSYGDRGERGDRGSYGNRGERGDRGSYGDRGDRGDRSSHGDRGKSDGRQGRKWSDGDSEDRHGDRRDRYEHRGGRRDHGDHHGDRRGDRYRDKHDYHGDRRKDSSSHEDKDSKTPSNKPHPQFEDGKEKIESKEHLEGKKAGDRFEEEGPTFSHPSRYAALLHSDSEDKDSPASEDEN